MRRAVGIAMSPNIVCLRSVRRCRGGFGSSPVNAYQRSAAGHHCQVQLLPPTKSFNCSIASGSCCVTVPSAARKSSRLSRLHVPGQSMPAGDKVTRWHSGHAIERSPAGANGTASSRAEADHGDGKGHKFAADAAHARAVDYCQVRCSQISPASSDARPRRRSRSRTLRFPTQVHGELFLPLV